MSETLLVRLDRLPLTYDECRARFRRASADAGVVAESHPLTARGPHGQELTIDIAVVGAASPQRALLVLSGVHGVEGFVHSALQTELLARRVADLPSEVAIVLVHAVNPWGMAHDRRQNESNVDLNRNWRRSAREPEHNVAYDELHPLACPDLSTVPSADDLLAVVGPVIAEHGEAWVRDGITKGQYRHPDGLHFGGHETQESCLILERVLSRLLKPVDRLLTLDLHTGIGPYGEMTLLSSQAPGSPQDTFLRGAFGSVDATVEQGSSSSVKSGPIAAGVSELLPGATCHAVTAEVGTASDLDQLVATYQEQWVHRRGDLAVPAQAAVRRRYRECFTPDDPEWESVALAQGRRVLDEAIDAVANWT